MTVPNRTLVIELKVNSAEGDEQTQRLAKDYVDRPAPQFLFLTFRGDQPRDKRFVSMSFDQLRELLKSVLDEPAGSSRLADIQGQATAYDYLSTLERMCGVAPINQHAARFWLRHGKAMKSAETDTARLLESLPAQVESAMRRMALELGDGLKVTRVSYEVATNRFVDPEVALVMHRPQWRAGDKPRFGVGFGQRRLAKHINPFDVNKRPFYGVWAADPEAQDALRIGMDRRVYQAL